jgi:glucose-6-phosphate 1-epimerase
VQVARLDERFGIPGLVRFERGGGGLTRAVARAGGATAHVYLHGAHVTHWEPPSSLPVLFISSRSAFAPGRAIRGGIPVIFPWFGPNPDDARAPDHGFARNLEWEVESVAAEKDAVAVDLALAPSDATRAAWPHAFLLRYRVRIGAVLELTLSVENRSTAPFAFQEALHTYVQVGDVEAATVQGLEETTYIDKAEGMVRKREGREPVRLRGLTDRVYLDTERACSINDPVLGRTVRIDKRGSRTTVLWNPGAEKARGMADISPEAWRSMLCVETANAVDNAVRLPPGERHEMTARLAAATGHVSPP